MRTREEVWLQLAEVEADKRLYYRAAQVQVNAPLALIQVDLEAQSRALRWCLGMAPRDFEAERKEKYGS